jgi:hypothetical protein
MAISMQELGAHCESLGLPFDDQGDNTAFTVLPFADPGEREALGPMLIEWLDDGRALRLTSDKVFNAGDLADRPEDIARLMSGLFAQTARNRFGSMGMTERFDVYYFYTFMLEDGSLTRAQFEAVLAGMMAGTRATLQAVQQFAAQTKAEAADAPAEEESVENQWQMALMAIEVMEKRLGTEEQLGGAWQFIGDLLKSDELPKEMRAHLMKLAAPILVLDGDERPVW